MSRFSRILLPAARRVEAAVERLFVREGAPPVIEPYLGYGSPAGLVLRGRVLTSLRRTAARPSAFALDQPAADGGAVRHP